MARRKEAKKSEGTPVPGPAAAKAPSDADGGLNAEHPELPGAPVLPPPTPLVLIVSGSRLERIRLVSRLGNCPVRCIQAESVQAALRATETQPCQLALIGGALPAGDAATLARALAKREPSSVSMLIADAPTLAQAVEAMRAGVIDIIPSRTTQGELAARVRSALERSRPARERDARLERLTRVCRKLNHARHEISRQVSGLCGDVASAYHDLADQVTLLSTASEFNSLIRQELDVESLLRTALEFILAKTGPTNAAVFLPATSCDFSLGAYVNYDRPKETADGILESLAAVVAPRMEHESGLKVLATPAEVAAAFGDHAHSLAESHVVAFSCRREGECLAVVLLFRDRRNPFPPAVLPALSMIAELFGKQLARVIHIHHRHLPRNQWGGFGALGDADDDIDLAA
ncbi:MAG: hypothetical protein WD749_06250 [Phycisphaerales bacterium]